MKNGIPWGICHFSFPWKKSTVFKDCPPLLVDDDTTMSSNEYWHYPLQKLYDDDDDTNATVTTGRDSSYIDPYDNHPDPSYVARPKVFFVVVRNPYDRVISMFHYRNRNNESVHHTRGSSASATATAVSFLNEWVQESVKHASPQNGGLNWPNSTICQYQYVYDEMTGRRVPRVQHIVQFEYLAEDFNPLAAQYGLDQSGLMITSSSHKENAHNYTDQTLDVVDLTTETLTLLNEKCPNDFELGRGYEMIWTQQEMKNMNDRRKPKWLL